MVHIVKFLLSDGTIIDVPSPQSPDGMDYRISRVLAVIKKWPGVTRGQITQRIRSITHKEREWAINELLQSGHINRVDGNKKTTYVCTVK
jgi:hypothetical protein